MSEKKQKNTGSEPKKHHRLRTVIIVLVVLIIIMAAASGGSDNSTNSGTNTNNSTSSVETEIAITEKDTRLQTETSETESGYKWDAGELAYLNMSRDELLEIYTTYDDMYDIFEFDGDIDTASGEELMAFESSCRDQIAEEHGITADDVDKIYMYGMDPEYFMTFDVDEVKLPYGDVESISANGSTVTLKMKITSSWNNKNTISQNYYNVCDFIRDYVGTDFSTISYWAVADMTDGSEQKVVSFDVPENVIKMIATQDFPDNQLGDYVTDLWVHQSLRSD